MSLLGAGGANWRAAVQCTRIDRQARRPTRRAWLKRIVLRTAAAKLTLPATPSFPLLPPAAGKLEFPTELAGGCGRRMRFRRGANSIRETQLARRYLLSPSVSFRPADQPAGSLFFVNSLD